MNLKTYKRGDIICYQGHVIKHAGIIIDGKCKVYTHYPEIGKAVQLGAFNEGDYFGEQLTIPKYPSIFSFNVVADSDIVKIAHFAHNEEIQSKMIASEFTMISQTAESLKEWVSNVKIKRWENHERKQQLIGLVREFSKNPRITTIDQCNNFFLHKQ